MSSELAKFAVFAQGLADVAGGMLRAQTTGLTTSAKADKTFVTSLDLQIEAALRERIAASFPAHGVWGEEFEATDTNATWVWTLDPIDGTMAFVAGVPVYSTLIALCRDGAPVLGVMHFPATQQRWVGVHGQPTTLNGHVCKTQAVASLDRAVMSASSPDFFHSPAEKRALVDLRQNCAWGVYGAAALAYGSLAGGRTHLALDAGLKIYDYAAFVPIIEGAGGVITDWQGSALNLHSGSQVLAAASGQLHNVARAALDNISTE